MADNLKPETPAQRALITGVTGQDGSYLTEMLLDKGYEIHGIVRRSSTLQRSRLNQMYADPETYEKRLFLHTQTWPTRQPSVVSSAKCNLPNSTIWPVSHMLG